MKENKSNKSGIDIRPFFAVDIDNADRGHTVFVGKSGAGKTQAGSVFLSAFRAQIKEGKSDE